MYIGTKYIIVKSIPKFYKYLTGKYYTRKKLLLYLYIIFNLKYTEANNPHQMSKIQKHFLPTKNKTNTNI